MPATETGSSPLLDNNVYEQTAVEMNLPSKECHPLQKRHFSQRTRKMGHPVAVATYSDFASRLRPRMGNNACLLAVLFPLADGAPAC
jgi:hypothetical protein